MAESAPLIQRDRHCAYCLKSLPSETVKLCGKCRRRAYCSHDCQKADWKQQRGSQGHKNWCGLPCGEEDIDWEVKPIAGKGLGIIAMHPIPAKYRIMVDALRRFDHPGIQDLKPIGGTLQEKIDLNGLGCGDNNHETAMCLRMSRINHDCACNSEHAYDSNHDVKCLTAKCDIQAGEEITISYLLCNDISSSVTPSVGRELLQNKWGVICKNDCFCRDKEIGRLVEQSRSYDQTIGRFALMGNTDQAMTMVRKLIENHDNIRSSFRAKSRTFFDGFQVGIARKSTYDEGIEYLRRAFEIDAAILHPNSKQVMEMKKYMDDPKSHIGYLYFEK